MRQDQLKAARGKVFDVPHIIRGTTKIRSMGIWPSGNVGVKKASDPEWFGPITVSPETAKLLMQAIDQYYPVRAK